MQDSSNLIPIDQVRHFSYSRASADETCRRKLYLSREWGGTGLVPTQSAWPLVHGNIMHNALEQLAKSGHIDLKRVQEKVVENSAACGFDVVAQRDWAALTVGLLLGFQKAVWPLLMAEYDIEDTEKWIIYDVKPGFRFRARQDLLLRNKFDGHLLYVDYKGCSTDSPQWIKSWNKSVQLHSSMYALKHCCGVEVERALVIGLYKGYKDKKKGFQRSPFTYGYVNREYSMSPSYSYEFTKARGWEMFPVAEEFDDPAEWVERMPMPLLTAQFPQTPPIFLNEDIAETWFRQQLIREVEIDEAVRLLHTSESVEGVNTVLDRYFRQNFSHCDPAYGYPCDYMNYCWTRHVAEDPLGSGQFIRYQENFEAD